MENFELLTLEKYLMFLNHYLSTNYKERSTCMSNIPMENELIFNRGNVEKRVEKKFCFFFTFFPHWTFDIIQG